MKLGIIGLGKMGQAILNGIKKAGLYKEKEIYLFDIDKEKLSLFNCNVCSSVKEIFEASDILLLAVKPQNFNEDFDNLKDDKKIILSIMAGITIHKLQKVFETKEVIRIMPNTPSVLMKGATALSTVDANNRTLKIAEDIFNSIGTTYIIDEKLMDIIVPLNGSMPAYLTMFAKSFIEHAIELGVDSLVARNICADAIIGSAAMIKESNKSLDTLISDVCSKKGSTIEGVNVLKERNLDEIIVSCYEATKNRNKELGEIK